MSGLSAAHFLPVPIPGASPVVSFPLVQRNTAKRTSGSFPTNRNTYRASWPDLPTVQTRIMQFHNYLRVGCAAVVLAAGVFIVHQVRSQTPVSTYTVHMLSRSEDMRSGTTFSMRHVFAVRSDGSTVAQNIVDRNGDVSVTSHITLPGEQKTVLVSHKLRRISTQHLPASATPDHLLYRSAPCNNAEGSGHAQAREYVAGIQTIKFVSVTSKASTTTYVAPSLNCMVLKQEDEWKDASGAIVSRTVKEATAVVKGEPPASLFEIPAGYIESKPSEMSMGLAQLLSER
jgi:hypothetical protein